MMKVAVFQWHATKAWIQRAHRSTTRRNKYKTISVLKRKITNDEMKSMKAVINNKLIYWASFHFFHALPGHRYGSAFSC